jgi:hypothetical protein
VWCDGLAIEILNELCKNDFNGVGAKNGPNIVSLGHKVDYCKIELWTYSLNQLKFIEAF